MDDDRRRLRHRGYHLIGPLLPLLHSPCGHAAAKARDLHGLQQGSLPQAGHVGGRRCGHFGRRHLRRRPLRRRRSSQLVGVESRRYVLHSDRLGLRDHLTRDLELPELEEGEKKSHDEYRAQIVEEISAGSSFLRVSYCLSVYMLR